MGVTAITYQPTHQPDTREIKPPRPDRPPPSQYWPVWGLALRTA